MLSVILLLSCGPKDAPVEAASAVPAHRAQAPAPLAPRPFTPPDAVEGTLDNGLRVVVVENHEVPLVWARVVFTAGSWTDPADKAGLASVTMDMMNEGAGGLDALQLSAEARKLAAEVGSGAGLDGSSVSLKAVVRNLEPSLDLWAKVLLSPTFEQDDWDLMLKKRQADLVAGREDPRQIASRAWDTVMYSGEYAGHEATEASYGSITTRDMKAWYSSHIVPGNALLLVGGDTTLEQITPLLNARLGTWKGKGSESELKTPAPFAPGQTTVYLVDKPGAAQSVLTVGQFVGRRSDDDYFSFYLGNMALGGMFMARINMNLREDKGWTYGARSGVSTNHMNLLWEVSTSVKTDTTADSIVEIMGEISGMLGERPMTADELAFSQGYLLGTWPQSFENPGYLLGEVEGMWRYHLPDDWISGYNARVRAVDLAGADAALKAHLDPERMAILVVGDADVVRPSLAVLGYPIVALDRDGLPIAATGDMGN